MIWLAIVFALADKKASKRKVVQAVLDGQVVMCAKHRGCGLLLWSDGSVGCYKGGPGN